MDREKNTPAAWMVFCASCRFMQTTAGMIAAGAGVVGAAAGVVAAGGAIVGVSVGAAACAVVTGRGVVGSAVGLVVAAQPVRAASIVTAIIAVRVVRPGESAFAAELFKSKSPAHSCTVGQMADVRDSPRQERWASVHSRRCRFGWYWQVVGKLVAGGGDWTVFGSPRTV